MPYGAPPLVRQLEDELLVRYDDLLFSQIQQSVRAAQAQHRQDFSRADFP